MQKAAYSPLEFCEAHGLARTTFYEMRKNGRGPTIFKVGRRTLVSLEAAAEWRKRMETESNANAEAVE